METTQRAYLPAAGHDQFLPLYDPLVKLLGGDKARRKLLDQAAIQANHRVLDIGCGTGTMVLLIRRLHPQAQVIGLDPDPKALARAHRKVQRARVPAQLDQGYADALPYPDATFDRVLSSFMFHHVPAEQRVRMLRESERVLKPGGSFHMVDFRNADSHGHGLLAHWLHSRQVLSDNSDERILALMKEARLTDARVVSHGRMFLLRTAYYEASVRR